MGLWYWSGEAIGWVRTHPENPKSYPPHPQQGLELARLWINVQDEPEWCHMDILQEKRRAWVVEDEPIDTEENEADKATVLGLLGIGGGAD